MVTVPPGFARRSGAVVLLVSLELSLEAVLGRV
jgi:hypothetical protein